MRQHPFLVRGYLCSFLMSDSKSAPGQFPCPAILHDHVAVLPMEAGVTVQKGDLLGYIGTCSSHGLQIAREASDPFEGLSSEKLDELQLLYDFLKNQQGEAGSAKLAPPPEDGVDIREYLSCVS